MAKLKPLDTAQKLAALNFAVAYSAFMEANRVDVSKRVWNDWNRLKVWGGVFAETQAALGMELLAPSLLAGIISDATRNMTRIDAFGAGVDPDTGKELTS